MGLGDDIGGVFQSANQLYEKKQIQKAFDTIQSQRDDWEQAYQDLHKQAKSLIDTLNVNYDERSKVAIERRLMNTALRGVVRDLLKELEKANPKSPLLNKEYRHQLFQRYEKMAIQGLEAEVVRDNKEYSYKVIQKIKQKPDLPHEHTTDL